MKSRVYTKSELTDGQKTQLGNIPHGICFKIGRRKDVFSTVTYPDFTRLGNGDCKRDCWNETKKRMERIPYRTLVKIIFSGNTESSEN